MVCPMINSKTYGTDDVGITFWDVGDWLKCIEFNTFIIDVRFYADRAGEIKVVLGLFRAIYFKVALQVGNGSL